MRKKNPNARPYGRTKGYVEKPSEEQPCPDCGRNMHLNFEKKTTHPYGGFWRFICIHCRYVRRTIIHPDLPERDRNEKLWRRFRLTTSDYEAMLESQGGVCALCKKPETVVDPRTGKPRRLAVDHNHRTGIVRKLLCWRCNARLGRIENPEKASDVQLNYLSGL